MKAMIWSYPPTRTIITCSGERKDKIINKIHQLPSSMLMILSFPKTEMTMRTMTRNKIGRGPSVCRNYKKKKRKQRGHLCKMCERASQVPSISQICASR